MASISGKSVKSLSTKTDVTTTDVALVSNSSGTTIQKMTFATLTAKILNSLGYSSLNTTSKTIIGAINEIKEPLSTLESSVNEAIEKADAAASKAEAAAGDFSNLTEKTTPATTDEYIFSDSGTLKKIKLTNLGNYLLETFTQSTFATTAKNILGAINELQTSLATAWSTINFHTEQLTYGTGLVHETKSGSITVSNGTGNATVSLTKSGYKALMVGELYTGSTWYTCVSTDFNISSQTARFFIRNAFDTSASGTVNISFVVLYIKTS